MKLVACTLGFANWQTHAATWSRLYPAFMRDVDRHFWVDNHYPLNREANRAVIYGMRTALNITKIDVQGDHGQAENFNRAFPHFGLDDGDYLVGIDPDAYIEGPPDTLMRCVRLLEAQPRLAWVSLEMDRTREAMRMHLRGGKMRFCPTTGLEVFEPLPGQPDAIDITVWRGSFLRAVGLRQRLNYYGEAELAMQRAANSMGMNYVYLMDHFSRSCREFVDPEYPAWKAAHVAGYKGSFADWLLAPKYGPGASPAERVREAIAQGRFG